MTDPQGGREVPEGESRKQVLVNERVRDYLRDRSQVNGKTYSEQISAWLPDEIEEDMIAFEDQDIVNIKPTPEIHETVTSMAGKRVSPGDVIAFYALIAAVENDDIENAAEFADIMPDLLARAVIQAAAAGGAGDD